MSMVAVGAVATVGNAVYGANAAKSAANAQVNAANSATQAQTQLANQARTAQSPYANAGAASINQLQSLLGLNQNKPNFALIAEDPGMQAYYKKAGVTPEQWVQAAEQEFSAGRYGSDPAQQLQVMQAQLQRAGATTDLSKYVGPNATQGQSNPGGPPIDLTKIPGYTFGMQQGTQAVENSAAARGTQLSGNTLRSLQDFGQGYAGQQYQNYLGQLSGIAGLGQAAASSQAATLGNLGQQVGSNMIGAGNAQAAGIVGQANAYTGAANNLVNTYTQQRALSSLFGGGSGGGGGSTFNPNTGVGPNTGGGAINLPTFE